MDLFLDKHGGKAVFGSHFLHLLRALMPFVAGDRRMHYWKFLRFNAIGCIVWASVFVLLGYVAGESWRVAAKWVGIASEILGGALLLALALGLLWRWVGRHEDDIKRRWQAFSGTSARGCPAPTICSPIGIFFSIVSRRAVIWDFI